MKQGPHPLHGIGLMLCAVLIFASMDATAKWLSTRYPVPMLVWARYTVHCLLMLMFLLPARGARLWATQRPRLQWLRALMLFGVTTFMIAAFQQLPLTMATAILFVTPLLVGLLAPSLLGERVGRGQRGAIAIGLVGMLLMARPGGEAPLLGLVFAGAGALCYTAYQLLTRLLAPTENSVTLLFYTALSGCLLSTLLLPWWGSSISPPLPDLLLIMSLGVLGGSGHYLLIRAFHHAPASLLAPFVYVQLIWAGLLDLLVFAHLPDGPSWLGIALIAAAGVYVISAERRQPRD